MKFFYKIFIIFIFFFSLASVSYSNQNLKFINLDILVQKTNIGKEMLSKINKLDQSNINKLKNFEDELTKIETEIKLKKNIISESEFEKDLDQLKKKINDYNKKKNLMVKSLNDFKNKELKIFFEKVNPIIQDFMKKNSIEILLESKNIFMGNEKIDVTLQLVNEINSKIKI